MNSCIYLRGLIARGKRIPPPPPPPLAPVLPLPFPLFDRFTEVVVLPTTLEPVEGAEDGSFVDGELSLLSLCAADDDDDGIRRLYFQRSGVTIPCGDESCILYGM